MKKLQQPKQKMLNCEYCKEEFMANRARSGIGYTSFCEECSGKRVWMRSFRLR